MSFQFTRQTKRLPCAPIEPVVAVEPSPELSGVGAGKSNSKEAREFTKAQQEQEKLNHEAWLAEWCNFQRVRWQQGQLSTQASTLLGNLPAWEWVSIRTAYYKIKKSILASAITMAVGPFVILADSELAHVTHVSIPGKERLAQLTHTTECFPAIYRFMERYIGKGGLPHRYYTQAFVEGLGLPRGSPPHQYGQGWAAGHGCTLLSSELLHAPDSIEGAMAAQQAMAEALAAHCFGCTVSAATEASVWLVRSLARFVALKYLKEIFGATYYSFTLSEDSELTSLLCDDYPSLSSAICGTACSAPVREYVTRRGVLMLHMVESRVGAEALGDTIREVAEHASGVNPKLREQARSLNCSHFFKLLENHAGLSAAQFIEKWLDNPHMPRLQCGYKFFAKPSPRTEYVMQQRRSTNFNRFHGPVAIRTHSV